MPAITVNLKNRHFGKLTARHREGNDEHGHALWFCECSCGGSKTVSATNLIHGHTTSCGCAGNWKARYLSTEDYLVQYLLRSYERGAKERSIIWQISEATFRALIFQPCYYCSVPPSNVIIRKRKEIRYNGIDRMDNAQGYLETNVVSCCTVCNQMKSDRSLREFLDHIRKVLANHD